MSFELFNRSQQTAANIPGTVSRYSQNKVCQVSDCARKPEDATAFCKTRYFYKNFFSSGFHMYFGTWIRRYFKIGQFLFGALPPSFVRARYFCFFRQLLLARRQADSLENFACKTFYTFYSSSFELTLGTKLRKFIFRRISEHETFHGEIQNRDFLVKASFKIPIISEFQTMKKQKIKFLLIISTFCSFYVVRPVQNPATRSIFLENLAPFTSYQLVVR